MTQQILPVLEIYLSSPIGSSRLISQMVSLASSLMHCANASVPSTTIPKVPPDIRAASSGPGSFADKELLEAVNDLVAQRPQVLLVTLGPLESDQYAKLFEAAAAAGTVVVIAAGNDGNKRPVPFAGTALLDRLMVVSAVALDGRPAEFTQRDPKSFWAPGVDFPVVLGDGKTEKRAGTTYAAALAAGIAARIVADGRATRPEDVIRVLRDTARPAAKRAEPPILRLDAALRA